MTRCYIFDIDGTIADLSHRIHHIRPGFNQDGTQLAKNWDAFYAACCDDTPIPHICDVASALSRFAKVVLVSGRSDQCRDATIEWLGRASIPYDRLYMRRAGDFRPDHVIKAELLDQIMADGYAPIMAFEDRAAVVAMWRERGIPCAQVAEGNF